MSTQSTQGCEPLTESQNAKLAKAISKCLKALPCDGSQAELREPILEVYSASIGEILVRPSFERCLTYSRQSSGYFSEHLCSLRIWWYNFSRRDLLRLSDQSLLDKAQQIELLDWEHLARAREYGESAYEAAKQNRSSRITQSLIQSGMQTTEWEDLLLQAVDWEHLARAREYGENAYEAAKQESGMQTTELEDLLLQSVVTSDPSILKNKYRVDEFIKRVKRETGRKITRRNIWRVSGYAEQTQFLKFQKDAADCSRAATKNLNRTLSMPGAEFIRQAEIRKREDAAKPGRARHKK